VKIVEMAFELLNSNMATAAFLKLLLVKESKMRIDLVRV